MADERSPWTRLILVLILFIPVALLILFYKGVDHRFDRVPFQYDIVENGDTAFHALPDFAFIDLQGDSVHRADLANTILFLSFFAVEDDGLDRTTVLMGNLQRIFDNIEWELDPPVRFVSINTGDSLAAIQAFAEARAHDAEHWWLLSGNPADADRIGGTSLNFPEFARWEAGNPAFTSQTVALIDKSGRVRKYYVATDLQEERKMQEDLITLLRLDYPEDLEVIRERR
ncbi:MAG: hypothetical protein D6722_01660 [Bacteroidetes bacterium]|nr:MAG: hypothetical protein D6722_01660 [Bacteroidota bacterium]